VGLAICSRANRKGEFKIEDEIVQYFVVNKDVEMSKGKMAVQVAHVATIIALKYINTGDFKEWYEGNQKKIVLQGNKKDLLKLIVKGFDFIRDNGLTEIEKDTLTCVGLQPMRRSMAQKYIKRLQLFKE
jgi:PTH2 family peptidyl-tRNA hydrolase